MRINDLAKRFPDLAGSLDAVIDRLVGLSALISRHVYHPQFRGSFSIKTVLLMRIAISEYQLQTRI